MKKQRTNIQPGFVTRLISRFNKAILSYDRKMLPWDLMFLVVLGLALIAWEPYMRFLFAVLGSWYIYTYICWRFKNNFY